MGQQQLLLISLGVIIIGIAVAVGISLFVDAAQASNRDAVTMDLYHLATIAQKHYRTPTLLGGGGNQFDNFTFPPILAQNANGTYEHIKQDHSDNHIHFEGTGIEPGWDGTNVIRVEVRVEIDTVRLIEHN